MLTERRGRILRSLIQEYTSTANPVSSEIVARNCGLGVSAATIRNEMAQLEEEGYVVQPHTSAGRVPSPKGYRYYVETLLEEWELARAEQELIRRQFDQARKEIEEWVHLTASVLSRMLGNVAIVTFPRVAEPRLKLVELISIREFLALLLLIFRDARLRQRTVSFDEVMSQEELNAISRRLTAACEGLTGTEIRSRADEFTAAEGRVTETLLEVMEEEGGEGLGEPYFEGLSRILSQPEFATTERAMLLMELLEERKALRAILSQALGDESLQVFIGGETPGPVMHDFSVVMGQYGLPGQAIGVIGVIGPTRMPYERAFSAVHFLSGTMSELMGEIYG